MIGHYQKMLLLFCRRNKSLIIRYTIFLVVALAPLLWFQSQLKYDIVGRGDFVTFFDVKRSFFSQFSVYDINTYNGWYSSFSVASLFPKGLLFLAFSAVGLNGPLSAAIYISILVFVSQISLFSLLRYLGFKLNKRSSGDSFILVGSCVLYATSPFFLSLISPGHVDALINYSLLPAIIMLVDKVLEDRKVVYKDVFALFCIFTLTSPSFSNVGVFYVNLITIFLYGIIFSAIFRKDIRQFVSKMFLVFLLLFLSNSWWILSFLPILPIYANLNDLTSLTSGLEVASKNASILSILSGQINSVGESRNYVSFAYLTIFPILIIFSLIGLIAKRGKYLILFLSLLIISIYISKGTNYPLPAMFNWFYDNVFGFKVFRRPISKYYGVFVFSTVTLSYLGALIMSSKSRLFSLATNMIYLFALVLSAYSFVMYRPLWEGLNIPKYYFESKAYLDGDTVGNIFMIPAPNNGSKYKFNAALNNYLGTDFLPNVWGYSILSPLRKGIGPNLPYRGIGENLYKDIITSGTSICSDARDLGVTHIAVREDVESDIPTSLYKDLLSRNYDISEAHTFETENGAISLYSLREECTKPLLYLNFGVIEFHKIGPLKYKIQIKNLNYESELVFLKNYDKDWLLFPDKKSYDSGTISTNDFFDARDLTYAFTKPTLNDTHFVANEYANGWIIDLLQLKDTCQDCISTNESGGTDINLILYYRSQSYLYVGLVVWAGVFIALISYSIREKLVQGKLLKKG